MNRIGTAHFVSFNAALKYYKAYGFTLAGVRDKIDTKEIHIGPPDIKPGQVLNIIEGEDRYEIWEGYQCRICKRVLNQPNDPLSHAGLDCLKCMAENGDSGAIALVKAIPIPQSTLEHSLSVRIYLPDQFGKGWDYTRPHYYDQYHAWAGSYSHSTDHNTAIDTLWAELKPEETLEDHCGYLIWAEFPLKGGDYIGAEVAELKRKVQSLVVRFPPKEPEQTTIED